MTSADAAATGARTIGYQPSLDGIRALAVLMVFGYHFNLLSGGFIGVDIFFVLSGFLITSILCREWAEAGAISLRRFYLRRALRLVPALYVFVLVAWLIARAVGPQWMEGRWTAYALLYVSNLTSAYGGDYPMGWVSHCWSLGMEEQFYLLWPPILLLCLKRNVPWQRMILGLALLIAASIAQREWLLSTQMETNPMLSSRLYFAPDTHAGALLLGCVIGLWRHHRPEPWLGAKSIASAVAGALLLAQLAFGTRFDELLEFTSVLDFAAVGSALLILGCHDARQPLARALSLPPLVWLGRISYSLYLWHALGGQIGWNIPTDSVTVAEVAKHVVPFVLAAASYYLVERPFLRLKDRFAGAQGAGAGGGARAAEASAR